MRRRTRVLSTDVNQSVEDTSSRCGWDCGTVEAQIVSLSDPLRLHGCLCFFFSPNLCFPSVRSGWDNVDSCRARGEKWVFFVHSMNAADYLKLANTIFHLTDDNKKIGPKCFPSNQILLHVTWPHDWSSWGNDVTSLSLMILSSDDIFGLNSWCCKTS